MYRIQKKYCMCYCKGFLIEKLKVTSLPWHVNAQRSLQALLPRLVQSLWKPCSFVDQELKILATQAGTEEHHKLFETQQLVCMFVKHILELYFCETHVELCFFSVDAYMSCRFAECHQQP